MQRLFSLAIAAFAAFAFAVEDVRAAEPNQVTGLTAVQRDGFTTLA
jgi:hypothetical protein